MVCCDRIQSTLHKKVNFKPVYPPAGLSLPVWCPSNEPSTSLLPLTMGLQGMAARYSEIRNQQNKNKYNQYINVHRFKPCKQINVYYRIKLSSRIFITYWQHAHSAYTYMYANDHFLQEVYQNWIRMLDFLKPKRWDMILICSKKLA